MLRLQCEGAIARLLIDRPQRANAMNLPMWQAIPALLAEAQADPALRVVEFGSATPGLFCAGADIAEMAAARDDLPLRAALQAAINAAGEALADCPRPVVAWVDGDAVGGGCALALACDIRIASARARFGITPARLGLAYPLRDMARLVELAGQGQARRLLLTGQLIGAEEALRIGLTDEIADSAHATLATIAANSAFSCDAARATLARVAQGQREDDAASLALFASAFDHADFAERSARFLGKDRR